MGEGSQKVTYGKVCMCVQSTSKNSVLNKDTLDVMRQMRVSSHSSELGHWQLKLETLGSQLPDFSDHHMYIHIHISTSP